MTTTNNQHATMNHSYTITKEDYSLAISGMDTDKSGSYFAVTQRRLAMWREEANASYYDHLRSAVWALINSGNPEAAAGGDKTEVEIRHDEVTAIPAQLDVRDWKLYYEADADDGKACCQTEEELGEWIAKILPLDPDVEAAFDTLERKSELDLVVWNARDYLASKTDVDPAPDGWETGYIVEAEDCAGAMYNIFPKGGNFENGKWMLVDKDGETILAERVDQMTESLLDEAVFAAETDSMKPLNWERVLIFANN